MSPENTAFPITTCTLPTAIRVYPEEVVSSKEEVREGPYEIAARPEAMLVFDTETTVDTAQRLTFGSYRFIVEGVCQEERLFYADDLPAKDIQTLKDYVAGHKAATADSHQWLLLPRHKFLKKFFTIAYKSRVPLVCFNAPFDISRLAYNVRNARGKYAGGFSLLIWSYQDKHWRPPDQFRPAISILHIDSKRALIGFRSRKNPDREDRIPEGSKDGKPADNYIFPGHFIDLRTLGYALTAKAGSLESMCEAFGVPYRKLPAEQHGVMTEAYIDYNRNDVLMTVELGKAMLEEYERHQLDRHPSKNIFHRLHRQGLFAEDGNQTGAGPPAGFPQ